MGISAFLLRGDVGDMSVEKVEDPIGFTSVSGRIVKPSWPGISVFIEDDRDEKFMCVLTFRIGSGMSPSVFSCH